MESWYYQHGHTDIHKGDYKQAFANYTRAININPEDPDCYSQCAFVYYTIGEYDRAIGDIDMAIDLNPENSFLYFYRGKIQSMHRNFDLAIPDLEKALELALPPDEEQEARDRLAELRGGG